MTNKISILVVDDEEDSRNGIAHFLLKSNFDVITAQNGKEALESFKENHHDLILADIRMPGISGIDLLKRVKTIAPRTEVIIITAYGEVESYLEAMNHGAFEYLNKPIKIRELKKVINKVVSQYKDNKLAEWNKQHESDRNLSRSI
jgi:DNA-binding NtrC family response regulator